MELNSGIWSNITNSAPSHKLSEISKSVRGNEELSEFSIKDCHLDAKYMDSMLNNISNVALLKIGNILLLK
jgi:hypothetical protein